jgi:rubrerythrin
LKRLAARGPSPWPVVSVYVNTRPVGTSMTTYRPYLKKRLTEELKAFKQRSPEHESLLVDTARVQHYLDYDLQESTRAAAVFACYGDGDLFDAVQIPIDFAEQRVSVGPLAALYPLMRVADRNHRAAVLVSDTHYARLFTVTLGAVEIRREIRNPALHKAKEAGEGDASHAQRHVDEAWRRHARQAAQALEDLAQESGATWLLIGGEIAILPEIEDALTPAARERLLGPFGWDTRIPEGELAKAVGEAVDERESAHRIARASELTAAAPHDGAVIGVDAVTQALAAGRVSELFLSDAFPANAEAWACRSCRSFGIGRIPGPACPVCGRTELQAVPLREEFGAQALSQGADVRFVTAASVPEFDAQGGVGAFTRYP